MKKEELKNLIKEELKKSIKLNSLKENYTQKPIFEEEEAVEEVEDVETEDTTTDEGGVEDAIGEIFIAKQPTKGQEAEKSVVSCTILDLSKKIANGELTTDDIIGVYKSEAKAINKVKKILKQQESELKEDIKTGSTQAKELDSKIAEIKAEIKAKTDESLENPGKRTDLDGLYTKLDNYLQLQGKLQGALTKHTPKKEEKPKDTKDNKPKPTKKDE